MEQITWTADFSVGVKELDEQHKTLIDLVNQLQLSVNKNSKVHSDAMRELGYIVEEIGKYSKNHLKYEEKLLKENNYPDIQAHTSSHTDFIKEFSKIYLASTGSSENINLPIYTFLKNWVEHHILKEDMKYKQFFEEKGIT